MFIGERIDASVARALYVDGLTVSAAATRLNVTRVTIRAARGRIDHNLKLLGLEFASPDAKRDEVLRLLERASGLTPAA
jgi:transposase